MSIEWNKVDTCNQIFKHLQGHILDGVNRLGLESGWTRLLAIPAGIAMAGLEVVKIIARIGEAVFKGIANIFGYPFAREELNFHRGVVQLFGESAAALAEGVGLGMVCLTVYPAMVIYDPAIFSSVTAE